VANELYSYALYEQVGYSLRADCGANDWLLSKGCCLLTASACNLNNNTAKLVGMRWRIQSTCYDKNVLRSSSWSFINTDRDSWFIHYNRVFHASQCLL